MEYKPRRKLTREFKLKAVRHAALSEKPKAQLARELGVRVGQLRTWGRLEEALAAVEQTLTLKPPAGHTDWLFLCRCRASLGLGRYDDAIAACEKSTSSGDSWPGSLSPHIFLVAAYALRGNDDRAHAEKTKLLTQRPGFSIAGFKAARISNVPAYMQQIEAHLYAGLRKAGIAEE